MTRTANRLEGRVMTSIIGLPFMLPMLVTILFSDRIQPIHNRLLAVLFALPWWVAIFGVSVRWSRSTANVVQFPLFATISFIGCAASRLDSSGLAIFSIVGIPILSLIALALVLLVEYGWTRVRAVKSSKAA